jgi:hypothetical protein
MENTNLDEMIKFGDGGKSAKISRLNNRLHDLAKRKTGAGPDELKTINAEITDLHGKISKLQSENTELNMNPENEDINEDIIEDADLDALLAQAELEEANKNKDETAVAEDVDIEKIEEGKETPDQLKKAIMKYKENLKSAKDDKAKATMISHISELQLKLDALEEAFGKKDDDKDDDADGKDDDNDGKADDDDNEPDDDDSKGEDKDKPKPDFLKKKDESTYVDDLAALTEGDESLSEDFKTKAGVIFEAALTEKVRLETERLQEEFDSKLIEESAKIREDLTEKVDNYLTYAVESWVEDNKIAIESGLRTEVAESFIEALKGVFVEHYIEVPETKKDVVAELETKLTEAQNALCATSAKEEALSEQVETLLRDKILSEAAESLADTQQARLQSLAQDVVFVDEASFRKKVSIIKECYFKGKAMVEEVEEDTSASYQTTEVVVEDANADADVSPTMQNYLKALGRANKAGAANIRVS